MFRWSSYDYARTAFDVRTKFNALTNGSILLSLIHAQRIIAAHFATPCQSMSWARSPQLRSALRPSGLPGLTEKQQRLVTLGNQLLAFTCSCCVGLHALGAFSALKILSYHACGFNKTC